MTGTASKPRAVTITGTRATEHREPDDYRELFDVYVSPFARTDVRFYLGGASGIDSLALLWLAGHTQAALSVVAPATLSDQPADAQEAVATVLQSGRLGELVELHGETRTPGYHARNRWMVDRSSFVIGFPHGEHPASGTWHTLNYAASQRKPRLMVPV